MAERVADIFMQEAMAYFVGDWAGYIAEEAKASRKWGLMVKWGVGKFLDCLKEEAPFVTKQDIAEWKEHIMHRLLF